MQYSILYLASGQILRRDEGDDKPGRPAVALEHIRSGRHVRALERAIVSFNVEISGYPFAYKRWSTQSAGTVAPLRCLGRA